jgi:hypothetical protein
LERVLLHTIFPNCLLFHYIFGRRLQMDNHSHYTAPLFFQNN